jgi:peptidoglycan/xylan/chitin deacetylase (PgdA/CDA1 family)
MKAILTFHAVEPRESLLALTPEGLRGLVLGIRASGHAIVPLAELLASPAPDRVALTFDDGLASVAEHALPLLRELEAPATLYLTTGYVGRDNGWPGQPPGIARLPMLDWDGVEALVRAGWAIEAHSVNHPDLRTCSEAEREDEVAGSCEAIERRLGTRPRSFAYPYGYLDPAVVACAGRHVACAVTTRLAPLDGEADDPLCLPRLDSYYLRGGWLQRRFGSAPANAWLALRAAARRVRGGA